MTQTSPVLSLPYIQASQAQKHVTHNEAVRLLDLAVQLVVRDANRTEPPAAPVLGDRHIVAAGALGDWAGQDGAVTVWDGSGWFFAAPQSGWQARDLSAGVTLFFDGAAWAADTLSPELLGINASADTTNRLALSSDASLFNNAGAGHQLKINKAAAADTASLLFQTGWSGRTELGNVGDDNFSLKVSADGSSFTEALSVDQTNGLVSLRGIDSQQVFVPYETMAEVSPPSTGGLVFISLVDPSFPQTPANGIFAYDVGSSPGLQTVWTGGKLINQGTTMLTGTTGPSSEVSVAVTATGKIQIENRYLTSGDRQFSLTYINGYRPLP
ncbi:MAG: DUF2793 domain-containing protein [Pseudomonadota bacterium]